MNQESKKEVFKFLIKEFHSEELPPLVERELKIPLYPKKIITIYGPRRSGKSFYFFSLIKSLIKKGIPKEKILYFNFEDDRILPLDFKELNFILEAYFELYPENKKEEIFLFFDEIQNIKNWEVFVRRLYEKEKAKIFITGSSSKLLSQEIATSLRGRTIRYGLHPLNFKEFLYFRKEKLERDFEYTSQRFKIKKLLEEYIEWGGFPEVVLEKDLTLKKKILAEYFNLLVYRDLAERFSLENVALLKELLKFLLANITSNFSVNSYFNALKQKLPVSRDTIYSYLSHIEEGQYFFLLPQFSYSLKVQKANPKKIVCLDNGLRNNIAFRFSQDKGKLAENLVGAILKSRENEVFYWKNKREVDFVLKRDNELSALNICFSDSIKEREIGSLLEFKEKFKKTKELILISQDIEKQEKGIKFLPLWKWLLK
jgi:predicted AAA+ superfamily ATPase